MAHCSTIKLRSSRPNFWKSSGASPGLAGDGAVAANGRGGVASLGMAGGRRVGSTSGGGRKGVGVGWERQVDPKAGEGGQDGDLAADQGELPGWAHGGLLERVVGRQRCHPYTIPCICEDEYRRL